MENLKDDETRKELPEILSTILLGSQIDKNKKSSLSYNKSIEKLKSFNVEKESIEIKLFSFFMKHLFLDEEGKFDLNVDTLKQKLSKNTIKKIFDSIIDNFYYLSYHLDKLFEDFNSESLKEFELYLFDYIEKNKNRNIKFVDRANLMGKIYNLSKEEIGLLSMICANKNFIDEYEEFKSEKEKINEEITEKEIEEEIEKKGLSTPEICVFRYIINEEKIQS